jgi:hypothetical protein
MTTVQILQLSINIWFLYIVAAILTDIVPVQGFLPVILMYICCCEIMSTILVSYPVNCPDLLLAKRKWLTVRATWVRHASPRAAHFSSLPLQPSSSTLTAYPPTSSPLSFSPSPASITAPPLEFCTLLLSFSLASPSLFPVFPLIYASLLHPHLSFLHFLSLLWSALFFTPFCSSLLFSSLTLHTLFSPPSLFFTLSFFTLPLLSLYLPSFCLVLCILFNLTSYTFQGQPHQAWWRMEVESDITPESQLVESSAWLVPNLTSQLISSWENLWHLLVN